MATVVGAVKEIVTSSVLAVHGGLEMVQRKIYVTPVIPENPEVGLDGVPMVPPAPEMILHEPEPDAGEFAPSVVDDPQIFWLVPALAVVGAAMNVIETSSVLAAQGGFEMVQRRV